MQVSEVTTGQKWTVEKTADELRDHSYVLKNNRKIRVLTSRSDFGLKDSLCPIEFNVHRYLFNRPFLEKRINNTSVSYLLATDRINSCKGRELPAERLPFAFDLNMSSKAMPGFGKGIVVWDEDGEVDIWKRVGGRWGNQKVFKNPDYPTLGLKLLDSQRMVSWENHNSIFLWLEKNASWMHTCFASSRYGPFDSHCDIECLDDHHFLSWDDSYIFIWTQKDGNWVAEKIDVFPGCEFPDDYAEEPVTESELDEEQSAFDLNPLLINSCRQQPSLTREALGIGQLFGRDAEVDGSDINEVSEVDSEISDSASLTSSEGSSPAYSINGVCTMDSKTVAYWGERQLMVLKLYDGGHWKSERLSEFDNSIKKVRLHTEGYLVVLSKDDNDNSTISSVNIIEQSGESQVTVISKISGLWDMDLLPDGRVVTADKRGEFTVWWEGGSKETWFSKRIGELEESRPWFKIQKDGSILSWTKKGGIKHWFECSSDWIINSIGPALDSENIEIIDDCFISARVKSPEHGLEADDLVFYHLYPSTEGGGEKIIDA